MTVDACVARYALGCLTALSALSFPSLAAAAAAEGAASAPAHAAVATAKSKAHAVAASNTKDGFTVERPPAWVQPLAVDPSIALDAASLQLLVDDEQVRVDANGTTRFLHFVRQINDAAGLQQGGQIEFEFDPGYQRLVLHKLEIVRDGKRLDKLDVKAVKMLHRETQLERQIIDGRMTAAIVLDDLRVGDRVEWSGSIIGANPVFGGRFADTVWSPSERGPTAQMRYRLLIAPEREIHLHAMDPAVQVSSTLHDGMRETVLTRHAVPQFRADPTVPAGEYLKLETDLSEFADWHEVAAWSQQLFSRAIAPTPALDAEVATLEAGAATPEAKMRAALDFVQQDIRYFGTEIGPGTHRPTDADTVLRQRFGDCKDKAALLTALLARMGFDAVPVLVSATYLQAVQQHEPTPLAFDHVIVRVMLAGEPIYLDATRNLQTGTLKAREARGFGAGLVARSDSTALAVLPDYRDVLHSETVDTFHFERLAEPGTLDTVTTLYGDLAEWTRASIAARQPAEVARSMTNEMQRLYPKLVMIGEPKIETLVEDDAVRITAHYRTDDFWSFPEQKFLFGRYAMYGLIAPLRSPEQASRTQPFRLGMPGRFLHSVRFEYGEPSSMTPASAHFDENNAQFELHVRFESGAQQQTFDGELRVTADEVSPAQWPAYREGLNKVAPRLVGGVVVPALGPAETQALRTEGARLMDDMKHGRPKASTTVQQAAYLRALYLDKVLASNRLQPKLRAQALLARGIQLDTVGHPEQAADSFAQALALDADSVEAHEAAAINAFERRDAAAALAQADETLRLAPSNTQARFTRAWTHYFASDLSTARGEFVDILQSRTEVERSYGAIWLYLTTRRLGGDEAGSAGAVKPFLPTASRPEWPYPVLQYLQGQLDFNAALAASRDGAQPNAGHECELYFFAGEKAIADGDPSQAHKLFDKSIATGVVEFNEFGMSQRELARLAAR